MRDDPAERTIHAPVDEEAETAIAKQLDCRRIVGVPGVLRSCRIRELLGACRREEC